MDDSWENLSVKLNPSVMEAVKSLKFATMTPVQAACIPLFMSNKDVAAEAVTGSGKTLAFVIPILEILLRRQDKLRKQEIGALIITPTRELAVQIDEVVRHFIKYLPQFSQALFIGGSNPTVDIQHFIEKGGNIVLATPGRLEDLFKRKLDNFSLASSVKSLEVLVLDEADRLLEMGFESSLNNILSYLPKLRRTGLFSATQTKDVEALIRAGLRNPVVVNVKEKNMEADSIQKTPSTLKNFYMICNADEKFNSLITFLWQRIGQKIMIFFSTCACVDYFSKIIGELVQKTTVLSIHGKMKTRRNKIFDKFRQIESGVLVCSDVMARGVDIPEVHWVIQYDPPSSACAFVHRCGRTARIGNTGNALVMLLPDEDAYLNFIKINQKVSLERLDPLEDVKDFLPKVQKMALKDRAVYDKGNRAFVSYIQAYKKHECHLIFRFKDIDFALLGKGFGLLRLPTMPELKNRKFPDFVTAEVSKIAYKDKQRERDRQQKLEIFRETGKWPSKKKLPPPKNVSWGKTKEKRKDQKVKKQERRSIKELRKRKAKMDELELAELSEDTRLLKKLKKGKITEADFNDRFVGKDEADENETDKPAAQMSTA